MAIRITPQQAEILALKALSFLADSAGTLERFAGENGVSIADIRSQATEKAFLIAVFDFLLADEALVVEFAKSVEIDPRLVGLAHHMLSQ